MKEVIYTKYLKQIREEFKDVDGSAIKEVIRHGLYMMTYFKMHNLDIYLNDDRQKRYYYFGQITNDLNKRKLINDKKIIRKLRVLYRANKIQYDGYYYFTISDKDFELHKQNKPIPYIIMHKIKEEAYLYKIGNHLFKVKVEDHTEWTYKIENYETNNAEFIQSRDDQGFKSSDNS